MEASLDAEGSDRYLFEQDYKPAINESISWMVALFNKAFGDNKLPEESLRELTYTKVFQANQFSRVNVDNVSIVGHSLWTVIGAYPEPEVYPATQPPSQQDPSLSVLRQDLTYIKSKYSATRLSSEAWNKNTDNIFVAGNNTLKDTSFKTYAYQNPFNNGSSNYTFQREIEIRPDVSGQFVAIAYIKKPNQITTQNSIIEFPDSLEEIIFQKALNFISYKQGDRTNLYSVTAQDVATLIKLLT